MEHQTGLESIHHSTAPHGLAVCYNKSKVVIDTVNIPDQTFSSHMFVLMSIEGKQVLLVLIYQPRAANQQELRLFIEELTTHIEELHIDEYNLIVLGDFNLDRMHDSYIDFNDILTRFAFTQRSNYSAYIYGEILDLVCHNRKQTPVE